MYIYIYIYIYLNMYTVEPTVIYITTSDNRSSVDPGASGYQNDHRKLVDLHHRHHRHLHRFIPHYYA